MKRVERKIALRCAVYTRVSTDSGLEQDFNSLDNPIRDRCAGAASRKIQSSNYQLSRRRQRAADPSPAWRPFSGRASHRDARA